MTYRYTGDIIQPYPGYFQMFVPEDPAEEITCGRLIGRPGQGGYVIDVARCTDPLGNAQPPLPIPPNDGRWVEETVPEG